jgi:hypothetical protein
MLLKLKFSAPKHLILYLPCWQQPTSKKILLGNSSSWKPYHLRDIYFILKEECLACAYIILIRTHWWIFAGVNTRKGTVTYAYLLRRVLWSNVDFDFSVENLPSFLPASLHKHLWRNLSQKIEVNICGKNKAYGDVIYLHCVSFIDIFDLLTIQVAPMFLI